MQLECMSSEESEGAVETLRDKVITVRGMPWRSTRLLKLYGILDEASRQGKPRRGAGRQCRNEGSPKDAFAMPPSGIGNWMISRRWLRDIQLAHPELMANLQGLIKDDPDFDWAQYDTLGYESDDEGDSLVSRRVTILPNTNNISYSLLDALQPVQYNASE